jgi:prolyl-tRNA synthetase
LTIEKVTFLFKMGCYGLGISRILAASVEVLSTDTELRWPNAIVPFSVCIVCPKEGSKEAEAIGEADHRLYDDLVNELNLVPRFIWLGTCEISALCTLGSTNLK